MTNDSKRTRFAAVDVLRSVSTLYIVGFWHMMNYVGGSDGYRNAVTHSTTVVVLGLFTMLSGFLLGQKRLTPSWASIRTFYVQRLIRIYPPLVLALLVFFAVRLIDLTMLVKGVTLLGVLFPPAPWTLWYICMIVLFYLVTPFLVVLRDGPGWFLTVSAALFALAGAVHLATGEIDPRLLIYYPCFVGGLWLATNAERITGRMLVLGAVASVISIPLALRVSLDDIESALSSIPMAFVVPTVVLVCALRYFPAIGPRWQAAFSWLSAASFFMYLFHRVLYRVLVFVFPLKDPTSRLLFLVVICVPLLSVLSWYGQTYYDRAVNRIAARRVRSPA